jgi:hypothetical protein
MKRLVLPLAVTLFVPGCVDLSAVRDFAKTSSAVSANEPVISGWPTNYDAAIKLAATPGLPPDLKTRLQEDAAAAKQDAPLAIQAAKALSLYFDVLGKLADDKLPDVSSDATAIATAIGKLDTGDKAAKGATSTLVDLIGVALDAWRKIAVRDLVIQSDPSIQVITAYLATVSLSVQKADKFAERVTDQYWETEGARSRDPAVQGLVLKQERTDDADYATRIAQADAAAAAFKKIGTDHALLARNASRLSAQDIQTTLSNDLPTLLNALKLFGAK